MAAKTEPNVLEKKQAGAEREKGLVPLFPLLPVHTP